MMVSDYIIDELDSIWRTLPDEVKELTIKFSPRRGIQLYSNLGYEYILAKDVDNVDNSSL